jgi:hypothetical protein
MITENLFWALPVLLAALLTSIITRKYKDRERFNNAADEFRAAFIEEQRLLSYNSLADTTGTNARDIIKNAINRHEIAMIKFKPFVCKSEIGNYEKTWKDYAGDSKHLEKYSAVRHIDIPAKKRYCT